MLVLLATLLREPISRTVSHYHYVMDLLFGRAVLVREKELSQEVKQLKLALFKRREELVKEDSWNSRNWFIQPHILFPNSVEFPLPRDKKAPIVGALPTKREWTLEDFVDFTEMASHNNYQTNALAGGFDGSLGTRDGAELLESAKKNLENFDFFGLAEEWESSILIFEKTFGTSLPIVGRAAKPREKDLEITAEARAKIAKTNQNDVILYQWARTLFQQRLSDLTGQH